MTDLVESNKALLFNLVLLSDYRLKCCNDSERRVANRTVLSRGEIGAPFASWNHTSIRMIFLLNASARRQLLATHTLHLVIQSYYLWTDALQCKVYPCWSLSNKELTKLFKICRVTLDSVKCTYIFIEICIPSTMYGVIINKWSFVDSCHSYSASDMRVCLIKVLWRNWIRLALYCTSQIPPSTF